MQPSRTPFVGRNFNVTRAGIHADGLLKNEEIYNIFDTGKFLNRPPLVSVSNTSGLAGIALWINSYYHLPKEKGVDKNSELVKMVKVWVDKQYEEGRVTVLTDNELVEEIGKCCKTVSYTHLHCEGSHFFMNICFDASDICDDASVFDISF